MKALDALLFDHNLLTPGVKPLGRVAVDDEHPLREGLRQFFVCNEHGGAPYDVVGGYVSEEVHGYDGLTDPVLRVVDRDEGPVLRTTYSSDFFRYAPVTDLVWFGSKYTLIGRFRYNTITDNPHVWTGPEWNDGGQFTRSTGTGIYHSADGDAKFLSSPGVVVGKMQTHVIRRDGTYCEYWIDGVLQDSDNTYSATSQLGLCYLTGDTNDRFDGDLSWLAGWSGRYLNDEEIEDFSTNPYGVLRPSPRQVWVPEIVQSGPVGGSNGVSSVSGVGRATIASQGLSEASSAVAGDTGSNTSTEGVVSGGSLATGSSNSEVKSGGLTQGASSATGITVVDTRVVGVAEGASSVDGVNITEKRSDGSGVGVSGVSGVASISGSAGDSVSTVAVVGESQAEVRSEGSSVASSVVNGMTSQGSTIGVADGVASVTGGATSNYHTQGLSGGLSSADGYGALTARSTGSATGGSTSTGESLTPSGSAGAVTGTASVNGETSVKVLAEGTSSNDGQVVGGASAESYVEGVASGSSILVGVSDSVSGSEGEAVGAVSAIGEARVESKAEGSVVARSTITGVSDIPVVNIGRIVMTDISERFILTRI